MLKQGNLLFDAGDIVFGNSDWLSVFVSGQTHPYPSQEGNWTQVFGDLFWQSLQMQKPVPNNISESRESMVQFAIWIGATLGGVAYFLILLDQVSSWRPVGKVVWPDTMLLLASTTIVLASACRHLPVQNIVLVTTGVVIIGGGVNLINTLAGIPFGPQQFTGTGGPEWLKRFPWQLPLVWVLALFSSRGTARLILRRWRRLRSYGLWLIGVTVVLMVIFDAALEPFAWQVRDYWVWERTRLPVHWQGVPVTNFVGWGVISVLILAFFTPFLINKNPASRQVSPDFLPLIVWELLMILFAIGAGCNRLWAATGFCVLMIIVVGVMAVRGNKKTEQRLT
jgi:uncharacterized membrane protein